MGALLRIVVAVLAAIVFSVTYLVVLALESRRDPHVRLADAPPVESAAPLPSDGAPPAAGS